MKIFCDMHHAGLLQSLILLFEKRLGGELYRPIGMEWAEQGYWKVYDHPATQLQYLGINGATPDGTPPLNNVEGVTQEPDPIYFCHDIDSDTTNKAITLSGFFARDIDIVIATIPAHIEPFYALCQLHPNKPKLIYQVGNAWNYDGSAPVKNIMASASMGGMSVGLNTIEYHQEFDTNIFCPTSGIPENNIYSFVNCFTIDQLFADDYGLFLNVERAMPEWNFKAYGGQCRDGAVGPALKLAKTMQQARFIWHTKQGGDGYGHIIHNAPAVGRPLIVKRQYYQNKMAEPLLRDGVTCIEIDGLNYQQVINKILHYNEPLIYAKMCRDAYTNFTELVDFDREFVRIQQFLANLI